jgi:hypothetical protein
VALIDTEHHSAEKYAGDFEFDTLNLDEPKIEAYEAAIKVACQAKYDVLVIDSLSHAWYAAQEMVDQAAAKMKSANTYMAWGSVTPKWNDFLRTIITTNLHVIGTARSKCDYVLEQTANGKTVPKKVGMAPIMREGAEYEFDVAAEMDLEHRMLIGKTRCPALDGQVFSKPGADVAEILTKWLSEGSEPTAQELFNALVLPCIKAGTFHRDYVESVLKNNNGDYAAARKEIEGTMALNQGAKA